MKSECGLAAVEVILDPGEYFVADCRFGESGEYGCCVGQFERFFQVNKDGDRVTTSCGGDIGY